MHEEGLPHYSNPSPLAVRKIAVQQKNRTLRAVKNKNKSTRSGVYTPGSGCIPSQNHCSSSSQSCCLIDSSLQDLLPSYMNMTQLRLPSCELQQCREEEETNVDTGYRVEPSECNGSLLSKFSRDLREGLPPPQELHCSCLGAGSTISLLSADRNYPSLPITRMKNRGSGEMQSGLQLRLSRACHGNEKEEDEEFFI